MSLVRATDLDHVPPGAVHEAIIGGVSYAICNAAGQLFAVSGDCPHSGGPLGHGTLHGYSLVCPWHAWEFDVRTGECDGRPDCRLATYPVTVSGSGVYLSTD